MTTAVANHTKYQHIYVGGVTCKAHITHSHSAAMQLDVDASNVPSKYILTILSECATFPRRLIFFVKGSFAVGFLTIGIFCVTSLHST